MRHFAPLSSGGGLAGAEAVRAVNRGQCIIRDLSSGILILLLGSHSNMRLRIASSSGESGRIDLRNLGFFRYARKVESSMEARFQGLRPQVRLTKITPRLHTSFGMVA